MQPTPTILFTDPPFSFAVSAGRWHIGYDHTCRTSNSPAKVTVQAKAFN